MNNEEMNNMIRKAQEMIQNNQIPDELKNMVANMQSSNNSNNSNHNFGKNNYNSNNNNNNRNYSSNYSNKPDYNKYSSTYSQKNNYPKQDTFNGNNSENTNNDFPNIDVETMMRIQNIMSKMKSADSNDDMSKLLLSLKPYLRDEKKSKIDEYIKLIKMGKMTQMFESFGGDKK